jgi:hypothetical protein
VADDDRANCRRGSYLCERLELRVTARCLVEDLDRRADAPFEDLLGQDTIKGFVASVALIQPTRAKVEPLSSGREVYTLGYGHRHRGATWHDEQNRVIWLCAYGRHESGASDDAFPYFKQLDAESRLLPAREGYERLVEDRNRRFTETVVHDAQLLLSEAREDPGVERSGVLADSVGVGVAVEVVETLEETYVAIRATDLRRSWLAIILAAFFPDADLRAWESTDDFPTRALREDELAYRHLRETAGSEPG